MPFFQVTTKFNSSNYSNDIECSNLDSVKTLFSRLSASTVTEIKEYTYIAKSKDIAYDDNSYVGTASITIVNEDDSQQYLKIPKFKKNVDYNQLTEDLKKFYPLLKYIKIKI